MNSSRYQTRERLLLVVSVLVPLCHGFVPLAQSFSRTRASLRDSNSDSEDEPDLFDYFDPLRSPHDYPDGIGPERESTSPGPKLPAGLDLFQSEFPTAFAGTGVPAEDPIENKFASSDKEEDEEEELDLFDVFDPTLSPHAYPNGIPSTKKSVKQQKVGILLMDHGSRNPDSNQRLHDLARLYQNSVGDEAAIVKAVHMEIASPSIPDGLQYLVEMGVSEIICHPYFLSPGRHVKQDIPEIVEKAIEELDIQIPVTTTPQLGSQTDLMITAIHSLVEESSGVLIKKLPQNNKSFGF